MLTKPASLTDQAIMSALETAYPVKVASLSFLPVGEASWSYKLVTESGEQFFVKLTKGMPYLPALLIPAFLQEELGYDFVLAPKRSKTGELRSALDSFTTVLYPFLRGTTAQDVSLSAAHWKTIGRAIRRLHELVLPTDLRTPLRQETFVPRWAREAREVMEHGLSRESRGIAGALVDFVRGKQGEIRTILSRADELGERVRNQKLELVLCHADPNRANIFQTTNGHLLLLDWDDVMMAPRERDLVFFTGPEQESFLRGYGETKISQLAIAFYKYEWVVQELHDFGKRVLVEDLDETSRRHAFDEFVQLFAPGDVVEAAYRADAELAREAL